MDIDQMRRNLGTLVDKNTLDGTIVFALLTDLVGAVVELRTSPPPAEKCPGKSHHFDEFTDKLRKVVDTDSAPEELADLAESAWGLIANSYGGDWSKATPEWRAAAKRWRDQWHELMTRVATRDI